MNPYEIKIYNPSGTLPKYGWFHFCTMCYSITSGLYILKNIEENIAYRVCLCFKCQKNLNNEEYRNRLHETCLNFLNNLNA